ncbi:MAG: polyphosphate kinase 1 [Bacteroidota bacterium]|nr:polyphosphate kinase 1 [Bacteroidota bacterium]
MDKRKIIERDISWLAFNGRVLQEAEDETVPLRERIRFLGISSSNLDEFFRVRVATLKRMIEIGAKGNMHMVASPEKVLEDINFKVSNQQNKFNSTWMTICENLQKQKIFLLNETQLDTEQQKFVVSYYNAFVRSNIVPLMIESIQVFPTLNDKSIYLACKLSKSDGTIAQKFALVSVPTRLSRFIILPSAEDENYIILLEDVIRFCLPQIFSYFGYDTFSAHIIKVTRDAEIDIDNDVSTSLLQKIEKGLKSRKKGKTVRFTFDKNIDSDVLNYLIKRLGLSNKDNLQSGARIHNFKDFINFPDSVFKEENPRKKPFIHPLLQNVSSVTNVIMERDVLLNFPYHSFDSVIDILREAAISPDVLSIKVTCYRLAPASNIINALTNAVRNGKSVTVVLELRARFDEEANIEWKETLEDAGVKVFIGMPNLKVHAKLCLIKRRVHNHTVHYGFVSTGNLNEKTSLVYGDHCLLTSDRHIMADVNRMFAYMEKPQNIQPLKACKKLIVSPVAMRKQFHVLIDKEIKSAKEDKPASIILKLNSLSDEELIMKLYAAARAGVKLKMIIRGIYCMFSQNKKFKKKVKAISIVDEYLEHARVLIFDHDGKEKIFISSADWMVRNLDHRIEAACPILDPEIQRELKDILNIQLSDNVKARILDNELSNEYVDGENAKKIRSQIDIYNYLLTKKYAPLETGSN